MIESKHSLLIESIIGTIPNISESGLFAGKAGIMIYLFHLAHRTQSTIHQELAEQLIDEICTEADKIASANIDNGLCGIAWSIEYLAQKNFIIVDTDDTLLEIDDRIFKYISSKSFDELISISDTLPGIAFYLIQRIKPHKDKENESIRLKKDLLISIINAIELQYNKESYIKLKYEPVLFSLADYKLPFYLYLIAELYELNFYNYKLDRIIDSIDSVILSTFPLKQSNRIYFILALHQLMQYKKSDNWKLHLTLLENTIDVEALLKNEFHNKSVLLNNGISGLLFLLGIFSTANQFQFYVSLRTRLIQKLDSSDYFNENEFLKNDDSGLLFGKAGIALSLVLHNILPDNILKEKELKQI